MRSVAAHGFVSALALGRQELDIEAACGLCGGIDRLTWLHVPTMLAVCSWCLRDPERDGERVAERLMKRDDSDSLMIY